jgi:dihydrofolate synthase / folylpolyglutamate synthase
VVRLLPKVFDARERAGIPATFFEVTTALALLHFAEQGVDSVVLEVGLGGRLDATNIVRPRLSIITSIGLEHTRILGGTIEKIAAEKAGVMKPGVPVVLGPNVPRPFLQNIASRVGSPVILTPEGPYPDFEDENVAIAKTAIEQGLVIGAALPKPITPEAARRGLACRPPCRYEVLKRRVAVGDEGRGREVTVVLDVGHNPPALERLFDLASRDFANRLLRVVVSRLDPWRNSLFRKLSF